MTRTDVFRDAGAQRRSTVAMEDIHKDNNFDRLPQAELCSTTVTAKVMVEAWKHGFATTAVFKKAASNSRRDY